MDLASVDKIIDEYRADKSWLVMILQDAQEVCNYLPEPVLRHVATRLHLPLSHVYRVATFYATFSLKERGKHLVRVCDGTACHMRGSVTLQDEIVRELHIRDGETTPDRTFTLETVACLGACALSPVMTIDSKYYSRLTPEKVRTTLHRYRDLAGAGRGGAAASAPPSGDASAGGGSPP